MTYYYDIVMLDIIIYQKNQALFLQILTNINYIIIFIAKIKYIIITMTYYYS